MKVALHRVLLAARLIAGIALITVAGTSPSTKAEQLEIVSNARQPAAQLHTLPESELKGAYLHCSRESTERIMGYGEIALCSIVYETVLKRIFAGDFDALLAWSRANSTPSASAAAGPR